MGNILNRYLFAVIAIILFISPAVFAAGPATVNIGSSGSFVILAKSGISTTGTTLITGNIGVSPISSTAITGFGLIMDSSNQFSTSSKVIGRIYAANYAFPTPSFLTTAVHNMETAYTDAAGRALPDHTGLGAGNIGGMTLSPGLYKWSTGVIIPADVILSGSSTDVWIFQIAQNLDVSSGKKIILSGGAQAKNIFWQVAGQTTLGTTSVFYGNVLCKTAIVLKTGAKLNGRALAQTAVTLDANNVILPAGPILSPTPTPAPNATPSSTPTPTITPTSSPTLTPSPTSSPTPKPTLTPTPRPTCKPSGPGIPAGLEPNGGTQICGNDVVLRSDAVSCATQYQFYIEDSKTKYGFWNFWYNYVGPNNSNRVYVFSASESQYIRFKMRAMVNGAWTGYSGFSTPFKCIAPATTPTPKVTPTPRPTCTATPTVTPTLHPTCTPKATPKPHRR